MAVVAPVMHGVLSGCHNLLSNSGSSISGLWRCVVKFVSDSMNILVKFDGSGGQVVNDVTVDMGQVVPASYGATVLKQ